MPLNKKKFSGKSTFNNVKGTWQQAGDYSIDYAHSKQSALKFKHKQNGYVELDGNFFLKNHNDIDLTLFVNKIKDPKVTDVCQKKVHLRVHHPKFLASLGVDEWVNHKPHSASAWFMHGHDFSDKQLYGGLNIGYNFGLHHLSFIKALLSVKHKKCNNWLEFTKKFSEEKVTNTIAYKWDSKLNDEIEFYGDVNYLLSEKSLKTEEKPVEKKDVKTKEPEWLRLCLLYDAGNDTKIKIRVRYYFIEGKQQKRIYVRIYPCIR